MMLSRKFFGQSAWILAGIAASFACAKKTAESELVDEAPSGIDWSGEGPTFSGSIGEGGSYSGDNDAVLTAQDAFPTGADLHQKVILRSCGPLSGVCHNKKEYPDIHTSYNFLATIGAPCNVQPGTLESVYDRCERPGDRVRFDDGPVVEIGWVDVIPDTTEGDDEPSAEMPGFHLHFADPVNAQDGRDHTASFIRTFVEGGAVEDLSYSSIRTQWYVFDEGKHLVGRMRWGVEDQVNQLVTAGVEQGDLNRNGVFGARPDADGKTHGPLALIEAGNPERSYIIGRMRGVLEGEVVPGTRMPLANPPFSMPEMLALFCFIEGLPTDGSANLDSRINYGGCSYSDPSRQAALQIEGVGTGWKERIAPLLDTNCGGCHAEERAQGDLILEGKSAYDNIVNKDAAEDAMGRKLIVPGDPSASYLYLKLLGDETITGTAMPFDPLQGVRKLDDQELADIEAWILDGAKP